MNANQLVQTLQSEITLSAGCTDPGCISLATASAVQTLGRPAERMTLWVSGNLLKMPSVWASRGRDAAEWRWLPPWAD